MRYLLHPNFLLLVGSFIGLSPYFFDSPYLSLYRTYIFDDRVLYVYLLGFLSFFLGGVLINILWIKKKIYKPQNTKDLNYFVLLVISISCLVFIKVVSTYGALPLISILSGSYEISSVNETQRSVGGGLYGIFSTCVFVLIALFPYSFKRYTRKKTYIFWLHFFLLVVFTTYSGKRQMIFILITFVCTCLYIYYYKLSDEHKLKLIKKYTIGFGVLAVGFFLLVGLVRSNVLEQGASIFDPVIQYSTLPYMNLTNIIINQESNPYSFTFLALFESLFAFLPSFFKGFFFDTYSSIEAMPLIEITSPSTVYGIVYWNFGLLGVSVYLFILGLIVNYFYYKAFYSRSDIFISFYAFSVWPLLSIHTYNHFVNFTFYLNPLFLLVFGGIVYKLIPKDNNGRKNEKMD